MKKDMFDFTDTIFGIIVLGMIAYVVIVCIGLLFTMVF